MPEPPIPPTHQTHRPDDCAHVETGNRRRSEARILLVEDHEPTRTALLNLLERHKYKVFAVESIAKAREIANQQTIDLVISDIGLPDGSGNDLMKELRDRFGLKGIALTGYGMEQDVLHTLTSGFVTHLIKPVRMEALEKELAAFDAMVL